jgi:hypothetical protein
MNSDYQREIGEFADAIQSRKQHSAKVSAQRLIEHAVRDRGTELRDAMRSKPQLSAFLTVALSGAEALVGVEAVRELRNLSGIRSER